MIPDRALKIDSPEHVPIVLIPAGLGRRTAAFVTDILLIGVLAQIASFITYALPEAVGPLVTITLTFMIMWGYHVFFELKNAGQTPGKRVARLRVADARGLPVTLAQSMVRNAARALDIIPLGGLGLVAVLIDPHRRRLGDLAAGTVVIEELQPPAPDLRSLRPLRNNSLDQPRVRRLIRHRLSLEEREFLLALTLRAETLDAQARYDLFEAAGERYRRMLAIDDVHLSGENLVRGLVAICYQMAG